MKQAFTAVICIISFFSFHAFTLSSNQLLHMHRTKCFRATSLSMQSLRVALTREAGANDKLLSLLGEEIDYFEIPCIEFDEGEDLDKLAAAIPEYDIIAITSPQAASVFLNAWEKINKPGVKVVTVGKGTSKPLIDAGITPLFKPSDSTAVTLAQELPTSLGETILYPSSALADNKLVGGLEARNFKVTRLNTYTTVPAQWTIQQMRLAGIMEVVTFASPSAVKTWASRVGTDAKAVAIGPTSAAAALKAGFLKVYSPAEGSKGIEPWADLIRKVSLSLVPDDEEDDELDGIL